MNSIDLRISKNAIRSLVLTFTLIVFFSCLEYLIKLFMMMFIPVEMGEIEAFLGVLAYFSVVGMAYLFVESYQKREWIFALFSIQPYPKMDFEEFKEEPQFEMRDWTDANKLVKSEIERMKKVLGLESDTVFEESNQTILPSLFDSAKGEENEEAQINQTQRRRKSFFDL